MVQKVTFSAHVEYNKYISITFWKIWAFHSVKVLFLQCMFYCFLVANRYKVTWKRTSYIFFILYAVNSEIIARVYFRETSHFRENKTLAIWRDHSVVY